MKSQSPFSGPSGGGRVIAVDPGTVATGWGVLEEEGGRISVVASGSLNTSPRHSPEEKLALIHGGLAEIIARYRPSVLVLEEVFFHRNFKTALKLGEVRGVCLLSAAEGGIKAVQYSPRRVKKAVVGTGAAAKQQVLKMVQVLLELPAAPSSFDVADALALGLTYFQDKRLKTDSGLEIQERSKSPCARMKGRFRTR